MPTPSPATMEEILKILVVDDDEVDRMAVRRSLKAAGLRVEVSEAGNCAETLAKLAMKGNWEVAESPLFPAFDCAFLDYRLPDGNGLELVRQVREAGIKIPLIVLTGQGDEQIAVDLMKAGASDYIAKAKLSSDVLSRSLHQALRVYRAETQAMLTAQQLKESEERYRLVLEGANDGIWDWDLTKNEVYWNDRFLEIIGLSRATPGMSEFGSTIEAFYERLHPEDRPRVQQALEAHLQQGVEYNVEFRLLHTSRTYRYCTGRGKAQRNFMGKPVRMAGMISDITDRKQAEAALERERQQLQQIVACAPVAMAMFDTQMRYLAHSHQWLTEYDLHGQSIIGKCHYDVLADVPEKWKQIHRRGLQGEVLSASEDLWQRANGTVIFQRWAIHPWYRPDGEVGGIVLVTNRINELVEAREAALEASRIKSQFLANVSHEIRTPMNGVLGMAQLLLHTSLEPKQHDYAQTIYRSAEHLLNVINDVLDFSKIEAGELRLEPLDFNLDSCLESVADMVEAQAEEKGLELTILTEATVPRALRGDAGRLNQILLNLVGNAVKFTDPQGAEGSQGQVMVRVSVKERRVEAGRPVVKLLFSVRDTGIGISPEGQKKLFLSFSQVDGSSTRPYAGSGLGLAISKQLVEMMGGEIGVRSSLGQGSNFWFTVPLVVQSGPVQPVAVAGQKLLVVSKNALTVAAIRSCADVWGVYCQEATDALALAMLRGEGPAVAAQGGWDAVLLDLQLPGLDPTFFAKAVQALPQVPRLIALAFRREQHKAEALCEQGAVGYLIKPIRASRLLECLQGLGLPNLLRVEPQPIPVTPPAIAPVCSSCKILLAEDHPINQQVIIDQLAVLGYRADCANNGQEALDLLEGRQYDLVLMDCQMPVLDGYAVTHRLRQLEGNQRRIIVIALTAHAMPDDREKCLAAGMDDYLSKPVDLEALATVLRKYNLMSQEIEQPDSHELQTHTETLSHQTESRVLQLLDGSDSESLLDGKRLQQLQRVNVALPQRLLKAFVESAQADLEATEQALKANDWNTVERQAHRLKGTCVNVGVPSMSQLAAQLERQARCYQTEPMRPDLPIEGVEELLVNLSRSLAKVKAFVQAQMSN